LTIVFIAIEVGRSVQCLESRSIVAIYLTINPKAIEAKQADLSRRFVQLGAELIALDQWTTSIVPVLYGAITTGDSWKFGRFDRTCRTLIRDTRLYSVPSDLTQLVAILLGIISGP
jgi:hypothetical protein